MRKFYKKLVDKILKVKIFSSFMIKNYEKYENLYENSHYLESYVPKENKTLELKDVEILVNNNKNSEFMKLNERSE